MGGEGGIERDAALCSECGRSAIVHRVGRHQCDTGVTMLGVVPTEKLLAMGTRILDRAETRREIRSVLQGLELRFGIRIVIRYMRTAVSFGDIEIDEQLGDRFGAHAGAAIGVQGERPRHDILFVDRIGNQLFGELRGLSMSDHPTDDVAAKNIEDHVQVKARPLGRSLQFADVPAPDFIRSDREQLRLGVHRVTSLSAPITDLAVGSQ